MQLLRLVNLRTEGEHEPAEKPCKPAEGKRINPSDLELTDAMNGLPPQTLKEARESLEREIVQAALRRHAGKITSAALELGISRPTLYELMEKLGIARE
jgi:two-component system NtrC family response regulator